MREKTFFYWYFSAIGVYFCVSILLKVLPYGYIINSILTILIMTIVILMIIMLITYFNLKNK